MPEPIRYPLPSDSDPAGADQRNGVILGHVLGARNGDTAAVSRVGAAGFTATFEIVAAAKAVVVG